MNSGFALAGRTANEISAVVEAGVRSGALPAGAALPPIRTAATQLGVSPATVAAAYQALRQRGIAESAGRQGTRVRPRPAVAPARGQFRLEVPDGVLDLATGGPDPRLLPDVGPGLARIAATSVPTGYAAAAGFPPLFDAARAALQRDGVDASELAVTGGALDGIERLLNAHMLPGDRVAVEDPGWANLLDLVAALGLRPVPVPVDESGPDPQRLADALRAGARAFVLTSRAQNPTGASVTADRASELRAVLEAQADVLVIEDDHAAELSVQPLFHLGGTTRAWGFVRSVSKPYGPDLRLAVVAGDATSIGRLTGRQRLGTGWVSLVLQRLVADMWADPRVASAVSAASAQYERRRSALVLALRSAGLSVTGRTGLNVWVAVPDETVAVARLREAGYAVAPGALYRLATPPAIRITISSLSTHDIPALASATAAAVGGHSLISGV
ncbi:aminotransferase class I/II-fold pyridoxal phosphate-dependent enzyme [Dactylosporangium vinaceum]|uniref:Aminotransferase class I/II-fold pyridoxal phosphate-dependent enzyme n=1 Tax=Dactylosporangium vinaceum TaxID=53362 RepID=A0ABV5M6M2_9ACTN|nr:aminotransferase class I/II-fold pyridoxal phosphate-dependent enzyme [Dactylosporangium vinaceum]UAB97883.1 aminotransferase class I/II-fold pyridoxal phosphate-dependent enzyme [Dactylosporangium vinaceum]